MVLNFNHAIRHVFVLMLENRSFDHLFALSGIAEITAATGTDSCPFPGGEAIAFSGGVPEVMPTDPGHEFYHVLEQLCGPNAVWPPSHVYPPIDNKGFVSSYAKTFATRPTRSDVAAIMAGVDTAKQLPAMYALATSYMLCDRWFSSLPGPTWPNRFFLHGASSAGLEHSPSAFDIGLWETTAGFKYPNGSVFDRLGPGTWRLYQDKSGPVSGQIPQVAALKGVHGGDVRSLDHLTADLAGDYPYVYTFIEPAYGDILHNSYRGGSSQHPRDGLAAGDRLVARVYNAIRQSSLWSSSLLIVTYDEHGGFYDSVSPLTAPAPGDAASFRHNRSGFDFTRYGVRVPALVVSPFVAKGKVDHIARDHATVAATLTELFGMTSLTERDRRAASLVAVLAGTARPDADCPYEVVGAAAGSPAEMIAEKLDPTPVDAARPVPDGSNLQAFLYVVRKTHAEAIGANSPEPGEATGFLPVAPPMMTIGEAGEYIDRLVPELFGASQR